MTPALPFVTDSAISAEGSAQDDKPRPLGEGGRAALGSTVWGGLARRSRARVPGGCAARHPAARRARRRAAGYLPAAALRPARRPNDMAMEWLAPATVTG